MENNNKASLIEEPMAKEFKKLPIEFTGVGEVKGVNFMQFHRNKKAAIYEVDYNYYEVFYITYQYESEKTINGEHIRFKSSEIYPRSNQFGVTAWTYNDYEKAIVKYVMISLGADSGNTD